MMDEEVSPVVTSISAPIDFIVSGWIILEARQLWSDLKYRFGVDDRRANLSFSSSGYILVAVPTPENPPDPPETIEGLRVITLQEYLYAVMEVMKATETIRKNIYETLNSNTF
jgi:hypothetical protein